MQQPYLVSFFAAATLSLLAILSDLTGLKLLLPPLGASCILIFASPEGAASQPRAILGGHLIATIIGSLLVYIFPGSLLAAGCGVGLSLYVMLKTKTFHPAAGGNPILLQLHGMTFKIAPMLIMGAIFLALTQVFYRFFISKKFRP